MSQTTRSKVRALERHRRVVARELAAFISDDELNVFEDDEGQLLIV